MAGPTQIMARVTPNLGCDPEFFLESQEGGVVASEVVIPKEGLDFNAKPFLAGIGAKKWFVRDGVQVEINPNPNACRANLSNEISNGFKAFRDYIKGKGVKVSFASMVELTEKDLNKMSDECKILGCAPSLNFYDNNAEIGVDPKTYNKRSGGGHIHIGLAPATLQSYKITRNIRELIPLMDILVGNTCVLIDRDPSAAERRKVYGRAGEHRLPPHGIEYRTLSNFWLNSYQLFSLVMGLTKMAVGIFSAASERPPMPGGYTAAQYEQYYPSANYRDFYAELMKRVNIEAVRDAINNNDLALATQNWLGVKEFIREFVPNSESWGLSAVTVDAFDYFAKKIQEEGLTYWFPQDPLDHWADKGDGHGQGIETFLRMVVKGEMFRSEQLKKKGLRFGIIPDLVRKGDKIVTEVTSLSAPKKRKILRKSKVAKKVGIDNYLSGITGVKKGRKRSEIRTTSQRNPR